MIRLSARSLSWREWPAVAPAWDGIHAACPGASFFLSREWVSCWLETYGARLEPELVLFSDAARPVGCCLLVWRTARVAGLRLRRVYLNCAGEDEADSTCIEYNSLAALPEAAAAVEQALIELLRGRRWDELYLPGMSAGATLARAVGTLGVSETQESPCHYVDLHAVRAGAGGYEAAMSAHCRKHIRRSQRYFERASGACVLHVAHTRAEAAAMLATLVELHEASWQRRGHAGAFASTSFLQFHRRLVESTFEQGRIMLAVLRAGDEPIGALYNFVYRGRVYVYQTGFIQPRDAQIRPGYLTHYLAVRHCLEAAPLAEYDFLAGDSIYKRSLATAARPLQWVTVRRRSFNALAFRALRWVKRGVRRLVRRARPAPPAGAAR